MSKNKALERACLATDLQWGRLSRLQNQKADILTGIELIGHWALSSGNTVNVISDLVSDIEQFVELVDAKNRTQKIMLALVKIEQGTDAIFDLLGGESHPEVMVRVRSLVVCQEAIFTEIQALDDCLEEEQLAAFAVKNTFWKRPVRDLLARCTDGFYRTLERLDVAIPPVLLPL